jgi:hypothetical protein
MNEYDKYFTKIIMSKYEILQNNKIKEEIKNLDLHVDKAKFTNLKFNNYLSIMFRVPDFIFFTIILSILAFIDKYNFSLSNLISIFMII